MEMRLYHPFILSILAVLSMTNAVACEVADVPRTLKEIDDNARQQFANAEGVYEGIIIASPDDRDGGTFWVIKTHKGQNRSFQFLHLPVAGGCIGALGPSGLADTGFLAIPDEPSNRFDGLVAPQIAQSWERQQLVEQGRVTTAKVFAVLGALLLVLVGLMWRFMLRGKRLK
ncbi:MAG: hypothetical protein F9K41_10775 [Sphingopyxis terrae]|nr:MAG: hypothetical protein F9K41_10775 [Sphingopyxis terrae]